MVSRPLDAADRHPAATYFGLTLALSWGVWLPLLSAVDGAMGRIVAIQGAFGPLTAAAVVIRLPGESARDWLASTLDWRCSPRWYAAALAVPIGVSGALGVVMIALTGGVDGSRVAPALGGFAIDVVFATLLGGFGLLALVLVGSYGPESLAGDVGAPPAWTRDQADRESTVDTTGVSQA